MPAASCRERRSTTWPYVFEVRVIELCPSSCLTSSRVKPWASSSVAAVWRRSWKRTRGRPARSRWN
jgi:hypothetical protein